MSIYSNGSFEDLGYDSPKRNLNILPAVFVDSCEPAMNPIQHLLAVHHAMAHHLPVHRHNL